MEEKMFDAVSREKYWHEKDDQQKIAKLAEAISGLAHLVKRQDELINKLKNHQHDKFGFLLTPLKDSDVSETPYWLRNPLNQEKK